MNKGGNAEEALAQYFRQAGFFAIRSLPFRHDNEDITDVDVWLYERGGGLERRRFIVDAKYKARPKIAERLLWTAGLKDALDVDGGFVAATGVRDASRRLAKRIGVSIVDFQALGGGSIEALTPRDRITREDLSKLLTDTDKQRESKQWRMHISDVLASLLSSFGGSSTNIAIRAAGFYAEQALMSAPKSSTSTTALRLFYLCAAAAATSLDYVAAQGAFQPLDKRKSDIEDILRFGADHHETQARINLALEMVRGFMPNGDTTANQLRDRIAEATSALPADILAEVATKMVGKGHLFEAAKILESAAHAIDLTGLAGLPGEAKAFCGALLDFLGIGREKFSRVWERGATSVGSSDQVPKTASLFDHSKPS